MAYTYLVTTQLTDIPNDDRPIIMVDGTVPGWEPRPQDKHFDHHRPGGANIQIEEISENVFISPDAIFVTTQVDADAQAAVAYIQLLQTNTFRPDSLSAKVLQAIAYDCDHLGLPPESSWDPYRDLAKNAVASLKMAGNVIAFELGLGSDRKAWSAEDKKLYASTCFQTGVERLYKAALGETQWPGKDGTADDYWAKVESLRPYVENCAYLLDRCAVLDNTVIPDCWSSGRGDSLIIATSP